MRCLRCLRCLSWPGAVLLLLQHRRPIRGGGQRVRLLHEARARWGGGESDITRRGWAKCCRGSGRRLEENCANGKTLACRKKKVAQKGVGRVGNMEIVCVCLSVWSGGRLSRTGQSGPENASPWQLQNRVAAAAAWAGQEATKLCSIIVGRSLVRCVFMRLGGWAKGYSEGRRVTGGACGWHNVMGSHPCTGSTLVADCRAISSLISGAAVEFATRETNNSSRGRGIGNGVAGMVWPLIAWFSQVSECE